MKRSEGQVLVFFALVLPLVLLPVAAYAVDASAALARHASLQAAVAEAAEFAAQRIDVAAVRADGTLRIDTTGLRAAIVKVLAAEEPLATLESIAVAGPIVTVIASETAPLPIPLAARSVVVRARATARIVAGYDSPSSFFPLSTSSF